MKYNLTSYPIGTRVIVSNGDNLYFEEVKIINKAPRMVEVLTSPNSYWSKEPINKWLHAGIWYIVTKVKEPIDELEKIKSEVNMLKKLLVPFDKNIRYKIDKVYMDCFIDTILNGSDCFDKMIPKAPPPEIKQEEKNEQTER